VRLRYPSEPVTGTDQYSGLRDDGPAPHQIRIDGQQQDKLRDRAPRKLPENVCVLGQQVPVVIRAPPDRSLPFGADSSTRT
jgi:hypothetical protein